MLHLVILLLASGCVTLCSHAHLVYYLIKESKTWQEAQSYCRENYTDLATIGSQEDLQRVGNVTAASGVNAEIWIGLKKTTVPTWLWSMRKTHTSHGLAEYANWASLPNASHHCGGMRADGKWLSASCETEHPFVCQEAEGKRGYVVVLQKRSWRKAEKHCRLNNTDLASVRSEPENQALQQKVGKSLSFFWIGLFRDQWKWSDQRSSSFRAWDDSQPNHDGICGLYNPHSRKWFDRGCATSRPFCCYNETKVTRLIVRLEMRSNSVLTFSDSAMGEAILSEIQSKFKGVKLQWRVQPDRKIFHKKDRKKFNKAC